MRCHVLSNCVKVAIMRRRRMSNWLYAILATLLTTVIGVGGLRNVAVRIPVAVSPGDTVTLECHYDLENDPLYTVKWYKGRQEFFRYIPKELPHTRVFPMPGINVDVSRSGANEVVLRDIQPHMAGKYRCEVSADAPNFHTFMVASYMHVVYVPEGEPKIVMEKQRYAVGDVLRGNCTSPPSNPAANLTWSINGMKMNESFLHRVPVDMDETFQERADNIIATTIMPNFPGFEITSGSNGAGAGAGAGGGAPPENHQTHTTIIGFELDIDADTFKDGKCRIVCIASIFHLYRAQAKLVLEEERPRLASVLGTRESSLGSSSKWSGQCFLILTLCLFISFVTR